MSMQQAWLRMTAQTWMDTVWWGYPVDEGGLRAPAEGVAMGEGLVIHQAAHGLNGCYDLLVCCLHISAHPTTLSKKIIKISRS